MPDAAPPSAPPHSREAEEGVIGSVLIHPEAFFTVAQFLQDDDFYIHRHRFIWQAFIRLQERRTPIDFTTLIDELDAMGSLAEIGGPAYLTALSNNVPSSLHAESYARIVEQHAIRRRMLDAANQVAKLAYMEAQPLASVIEQSERAIADASGRMTSKALRPLSAVMADVFDHVDQAANAGHPPGIPSGFLDLDALLGGWQNSDLIIIAGRPGMGKTSLLLSAARHAVQACSKTLAFFSLEMSAEQLGVRLAALETGIDSQRIRLGKLRDDEWTTFAQSAETLAGLPMFVDDTHSLTPAQLRAKCIRLQRENGLDLIVLDYMQLMAGGGRFENRQQEVSYISRQLKALAKELAIPVIAAAQLSRAVEQRADKHPTLSDLRESGQIEQDSDVVIFLYRDVAGSNFVDVDVAKHRNGPVGSIQLVFRQNLTKFENAVRRTAGL